MTRLSFLGAVLLALTVGPSSVQATAPPIVFGDSLSVMVAPRLAAHGVVTVARVGEQFNTGYEDLVQRQRRLHRVVIELGTNGPIDPRLWATLLRRLSVPQVTRVVLVAPYAVRPWIAENDRLYLRARATHRTRVRLVYWPLLVRRDPGLLGPDGVHPTFRGEVVLTRAILRGLEGP